MVVMFNVFEGNSIYHNYKSKKSTKSKSSLGNNCMSIENATI